MKTIAYVEDGYLNHHHVEDIIEKLRNESQDARIVVSAGNESAEACGKKLHEAAMWMFEEKPPYREALEAYLECGLTFSKARLAAIISCMPEWYAPHRRGSKLPVFCWEYAPPVCSRRGSADPDCALDFRLSDWPNLEADRSHGLGAFWADTSYAGKS